MKDKQYIVSDVELARLVYDQFKRNYYDKNVIRNFLKSKKPVDTLDRDKVKQLIEGCCYGEAEHIDKWLIDQICNLIPKQQSWNEDRVREIVEKFHKEHSTMQGFSMPIDDLIKELSQLSALDKSMDREKVLFYSTIDCSAGSSSSSLEKVNLDIPQEFWNKLFAICIRDVNENDAICKGDK